jgi:hypothetical protein
MYGLFYLYWLHGFKLQNVLVTQDYLQGVYPIKGKLYNLYVYLYTGCFKHSITLGVSSSYIDTSFLNPILFAICTSTFSNCV